MRLYAITGMRYAPKVALTKALASALAAAGQRVMLFDNTEQPIALDDTARQRFAAGCVCCSLAASLIPAVWNADCDAALLPVGAAADPEMLAHVLHTIQNTRVQATTIALIDAHTRQHAAYAAKRLAFYADNVFHEPFDVDAMVRAQGLAVASP
jgi:hypothetical protein